MDYDRVIPAVFCSRPNRFIALCQVGETIHRAHVPNTGRCAELLVPGAQVLLHPAASPSRSTAFTLVSVYKQGRLINLDSAAPNRLVAEALASGKLLFKGEVAQLIKPEASFGRTRFDFYLETETFQGYLEVKGCTLEENGVCFFPDAPTLRGLRHLQELTALAAGEVAAGVVFVVQMEQADHFAPNRRTQPEFADALIAAQRAGVSVEAFTCQVRPQRVLLDRPLPVRLKP